MLKNVKKSLARSPSYVIEKVTGAGDGDRRGAARW
jgi:hypothetical protein